PTLSVVALLAYSCPACGVFNLQFLYLDYSADALARSARHPYLEPLMRALSDVGSGYALVPLSVLTFVLLRRHGHRAARFIPAMVIGSDVVLALTTWTVARPRPRPP